MPKETGLAGFVTSNPLGAIGVFAVCVIGFVLLAQNWRGIVKILRAVRGTNGHAAEDTDTTPRPSLASPPSGTARLVEYQEWEDSKRGIWRAINGAAAIARDADTRLNVVKDEIKTLRLKADAQAVEQGRLRADHENLCERVDDATKELREANSRLDRLLGRLGA